MQFCEEKPGVTVAFPFDQDTLVFKVMGKMFALTSLSKWENGERRVNLKCDPEKALELRTQFPEEVLPGYHMSKKHWNTVVMDGNMLSRKRKFHLINHSYELVVSKLPKKLREELKNSGMDE